MARPACATVLVLLAFLGATGRAEGAAPRLEVAGTEFRLVGADGRVQGGEALVGAELTVVDGDRTRHLRIESTRLDPAAADGAVRLYDLSVRDAGTGAWSPLCDPGPDGLALAFPLAGRFTDNGGYEPDPSRFTLTCTGGAIGKCVRFGYRPWSQAPDGTALLDHYRACLRMARADYCGDGRGWTRDGMLIDIIDAVGIQHREEAPGFAFEAAWAPDGARCVAHVRVPENGSLDDLVRACPRLRGHVGPEACPEVQPGTDGVLLINRSRVAGAATPP